MANATLLPNFKSKRRLPMALRQKLRKFVTSFVNQEDRLKGAREEDCDDDFSREACLKHVLAILYVDTWILIEPKSLLPVIDRLELCRKWEPIIVINYLSHLQTFLEYCDCYEKNRFDKDFT